MKLIKLDHTDVVSIVNRPITELLERNFLCKCGNDIFISHIYFISLPEDSTHYKEFLPNIHKDDRSFCVYVFDEVLELNFPINQLVELYEIIHETQNN